MDLRLLSGFHKEAVGRFVPYLPNSRHVELSQQSTPQIHNKRWRFGNLHHAAWVEVPTVGTRSIPTVHPCSQNGKRLWVARKHHNLTSPIRTNHTRNYHMVAEHVPRSTARQESSGLKKFVCELTSDRDRANAEMSAVVEYLDKLNDVRGEFAEAFG